MPLDPQIARILAERSPLPRHMLPIGELRSGLNSRTSANQTKVGKVEDLHVTSEQTDVPIRIYWPFGRPDGCFLFFHGGGFVGGSLDTHDHICRDICLAANCVVIATDYRLAPEHPFPSALHDCAAVLSWVVSHGGFLGLDDPKIVVGGDSAGGNLATVLVARSRQRREGRISGQVLIYPITDVPRLSRTSYVENGAGYGLSSDDMLRFWRDYAGEAPDVNDPAIAPVRSSELAGLPDTLVITAEFDPLRDEGEEYARRLMEAGVPTTLTRYDGAIHGFVRMGSEVRLAAQALRQISQWLGERFSDQEPHAHHRQVAKASEVGRNGIGS
ncbi:alpha/beta hydrolase [Microbaculum marinum]|uniref:Alpha/beta hydrolase n=2 Tax=Microbaculum marinum TaxID=1764581 RepID=A0AAW9RVA0_9HYPH